MSDKNIDLKKSSKKLKNKITYRIFILVGFGMFIPFLSLFMISWRYYYDAIGDEKDKYIENIRMERANDITRYYLSLEDEIKEIIIQEDGFLNKKNIKDSYIKILNKKLGVENIILLDNKYDILYNAFDFNVDELKDEFINIFFSNAYYVGDFKRVRNKYYQYVYYKFLINNEERYLVLYINNDFFNKNNKNEDGIVYEVISKDFHLVNNNNKSIRTLMIDGIAKKMLDGNEGLADMNENRFSFGNIRINDFYLYLRVYYDKNIIYSNMGSYLILFSLMLIFSFSGYIVISWSLRKNMIEYTRSATRIGIETKSDKRYPYLKYDIVKLFDYTENLFESLNNIEEFYYHLKLIKNRIVSQNKELINKNKDKEEIIKKVKSDDELLAEIKSLKIDDKEE